MVFVSSKTIKMKGIIMSSCCRHYGLMNFLLDVFMVLITGGLWLIWIFIREMRNS